MAELRTHTPLADRSTPLMVLDDHALGSNIAVMADWARERGVLLAPHGKTTMAPALWRRQLDAGAWGITVANAQQLAVALAHQMLNVLVANELLDAPALRAAQGRDVLSWVDSLAAIQVMEAALADGHRWDLLVELGWPGARTGARSIDEALDVARAIAASDKLRLRGVGGYEGALAHDRQPQSLADVRAYLRSTRELFDRVADAGLLADDTQPIITAGGSTYPDLVADELADLAGRGVAVVLRSGAYIAHDDGNYALHSPLRDQLVSAMHVWARVLSRPEPTLALLDAGRRDVSFDLSLPVPQLASDRLGGPGRELSGADIIELNDQHAFVRLDADDPLAVGQYVRLGLSHPCTVFDKWRTIPLLRDGEVVDEIETFF